jgi:hypothetical protein
MLAIVTAVLIVGGGALIITAFWTRWLKDFQLGPVIMWARGDEVRRQEERNIRVQNKQAAFFWKLLPVGLIMLAIGVVLFVLSFF